MFQCKLYGRDLITDNKDLHEILTSEILEGENGIAHRLEREFPDLQREAVTALKELDVKQVRSTLIVYMNHRLQAWAGQQYDVDPSSVRVVRQAGKKHERRA